MTQWKHLHGIWQIKEQIPFLFIQGGFPSPTQKPNQIDVFYGVPWSYFAQRGR